MNSKIKKFLSFRFNGIKDSIKNNVFGIIVFIESIIITVVIIAFIVGKEVDYNEYLLIKYGLIGLPLIISIIISTMKIKNKYKIIYGIGLLLYAIILLIIIIWID